MINKVLLIVKTQYIKYLFLFLFYNIINYVIFRKNILYIIKINKILVKNNYNYMIKNIKKEKSILYNLCFFKILIFIKYKDKFRKIFSKKI